MTTTQMEQAKLASKIASMDAGYNDEVEAEARIAERFGWAIALSAIATSAADRAYVDDELHAVASEIMAANMTVAHARRLAFAFMARIGA